MQTQTIPDTTGSADKLSTCAWSGDVVEVRRKPWFTRGFDRPSLIVLGLSTWAMVGALIAFAKGSPTWTLATALGAPILATSLVVEVIAWFNRVWIRDGLVHRGKLLLPEFANQCLLMPLARNHRSKWFDARSWVRTLPESTDPRIILLKTSPLTPFPIPGDVFEEVDLLSQREISRSTRRAAIRTIVVIGGVIVYFMLPAIRAGSLRAVPSHLLFLSAWYIGFLIWYLARVGWSPLHFRSVVARPGEISVSSLRGSPVVFTRRDSVLIFTTERRKQIRVRFCREDGQQAHIDFVGRMDEPGIAQLLGRWCYPDHAARAGRGDELAARVVQVGVEREPA